jgi:hypothetical protein
LLVLPYLNVSVGFLTSMCLCVSLPECVCVFPYLNVSGGRYLVKRGMGRKKSVMGMSVNGFKNLKKRFFVLSNEGLSYHKEKGTSRLAVYPIEPIP